MKGTRSRASSVVERSNFLSKELQEEFKHKQPAINNESLFQPKKERKIATAENSMVPV